MSGGPGPLVQSAAHLTAIQEVFSSRLGPSPITLVDIGHEIISTAILSLLLIQLGQLSVNGKIMCTFYWLTDQAVCVCVGHTLHMAKDS